MSSTDREAAGRLADLTRLAQQNPAQFYALALRTRSVVTRDALAHAALPGARSAALQEIGRAVLDGLDPVGLGSPSVDPARLSDLAAVCAVQVAPGVPDPLGALGLWEWAEQLDPAASLPAHRDLRAQVAHADGGAAFAPRVRRWAADPELLGAEVRTELRADLSNPWGSDPQAGSTRAWEAAVAPLHGAGLEPVSIAAGPGAAFDRLATATVDPVPTTGSIAVILTTFRPDHSLLTAVRSIVAQSWSDWHLIVVDDASGPQYDELLATVADLDRRITVLRSERNGGTYRARNLGLRHLGEAEFITFHDTDDWSHPRRLERSVQPLLEDSELVASAARCIKASEDLALTRVGYRGISRMAASFMVRRDIVTEHIGFFDPVRKAADNEYRRRITSAFPGRIREVMDPVAWVRRGHESLSASDHSRGWRHHSRRHYTQSYALWHRKIARGDTDPYLDDTAARQLWAPRRWVDDVPPGLTAPASEPAVATDFPAVLIGDFATADAPRETAFRTARKAYRRVGLMQVDGLTMIPGDEPATSAAVLRRVIRGHLDWVYLDEPLRIGRVIVMDPELVRSGFDQPTAWSVSEVAVAFPADEDGPRRRSVARVIRSTFHVEPRWWDPRESVLPPLTS